MQLPSSWHFLLLFVTSSIADWSLDSPSAAGSLDDPALQLRLDWNSNGITDGSPTSTIDGVPTFARVPQDENVGGVENVGEDPFEVASGCSPPPPGKRRRRVRRGDPTLCSSGYSFQNTPSQFKETTEQRRQQKPTTNPGTKKAPSANASPRRFVPQLSPEAEHLSKVFLPQENRPQSDDYTCRKEGYYIPVCAHEDSESLGLMGARYVNFLDPCYPCTSLFLFPPSPSLLPSLLYPYPQSIQRKKKTKRRKRKYKNTTTDD